MNDSRSTDPNSTWRLILAVVQLLCVRYLEQLVDDACQTIARRTLIISLYLAVLCLYCLALHTKTVALSETVLGLLFVMVAYNMWLKNNRQLSPQLVSLAFAMALLVVQRFLPN